MSLLDLIFSVDSMQSLNSLKSLGHITKRLIAYQPMDSYQEYMEKCLLPTLSRLISDFKARGITLPFEPVSSFSAEIMKLYVVRIVGNANTVIPEESLGKFGCGCQNCLSVRRFFMNKQSSISIREVKHVRTHLERMLQSCGASRHGFRWHTLTGSSPQILQVWCSLWPRLLPLTVCRYRNRLITQESMIFGLGERRLLSYLELSGTVLSKNRS